MRTICIHIWEWSSGITRVDVTLCNNLWGFCRQWGFFSPGWATINSSSSSHNPSFPVPISSDTDILSKVRSWRLPKILVEFWYLLQTAINVINVYILQGIPLWMKSLSPLPLCDASNSCTNMCSLKNPHFFGFSLDLWKLKFLYENWKYICFAEIKNSSILHCKQKLVMHTIDCASPSPPWRSSFINRQKMDWSKY